MPAWLNDITDARVIEALTRKCGLCGMKPGTPCRHPWETKPDDPPLNRIVHHERATQYLEKAGRR